MYLRGTMFKKLDDMFTGERKSLIVSYGFLAFFGAFGVHRFYLNKPCTGVVYALTGGILGFGIFYDFFMMPLHVIGANRHNQ